MNTRGGEGVRRAAIKALMEEGKSVREIAEILQVSTQVVYRHKRLLIEAGELDA